MPFASQVAMQCLPNMWPQAKRTGFSELTLMAVKPTVLSRYGEVQILHTRSLVESSWIGTTGRLAMKDLKLSGGSGRTWVSDAIGWLLLYDQGRKAFD